MTLVNSMSSGVGRGPHCRRTVMLGVGLALVGMVALSIVVSCPLRLGVRLLPIAPLILQPLRAAGSAELDRWIATSG